MKKPNRTTAQAVLEAIDADACPNDGGSMSLARNYVYGCDDCRELFTLALEKALKKRGVRFPKEA